MKTALGNLIGEVSVYLTQNGLRFLLETRDLLSAFRCPTKQQNLIWLKRRQHIRPSAIAKELHVSAPFITKAQRTAEHRIENLMSNAAYVNRIRLTQVSPANGFALGYCAAYKTDTYITYSPKIGVQVWYSHSGDCAHCEMNNECQSILKELAVEWGVPIPEGRKPTDIAATLFGEIKERLGWK